MTGRNDVHTEIRQLLTTRRARLTPRKQAFPPTAGTGWTTRLRPLTKEPPVPIQPKQPTTKGPAEWFTGDVFLDPIVRGEEPSRVRVSAVRFTPGARTAWHAHAVGQTLYVTDGQGLVQSRGGAVEAIRAGDVVSTPPGEWHWHGAAPDHYMTHLSITEAPGDERPEADWGEHVTDAEYHHRSM